MIRLFKNLQNFWDIFKKNYFFQKCWGCPGPPWSSSGSTTVSDQKYLNLLFVLDIGK